MKVALPAEIVHVQYTSDLDTHSLREVVRGLDVDSELQVD